MLRVAEKIGEHLRRSVHLAIGHLEGDDGAGPVQQLINGIGAFALLLSLVGIIIGGAMWGVGSLSSNYHQAAVGKRATLYSVVGAVIVGAAAALVNWAFSLGQTA